MRVWHAEGPVGSRFEKVRVRIVAYLEQHWPDHQQRIVVQSFEGNRPVAEDPLFEGHATREQIAEFIESSLDDGWRLTSIPA